MIIHEYTTRASRLFAVAFDSAGPMMLAVEVAAGCRLTVAQRPAATAAGFNIYTFPTLPADPAATYTLCLRLAQRASSPMDFWRALIPHLLPHLPDDTEMPVVECTAHPWLPARLGLRSTIHHHEDASHV